MLFLSISVRNTRICWHIAWMLEYRIECVPIHSRHSKLITALRTAAENCEGMVGKEATSHDDLFDAFRMSMQFWHLH